MSEQENNKKIEVVGLAHNIMMKLIAFFVILISFIAITITFIYMAVKNYELGLVIAVGGSDTLVGYLMILITKKLFGIEK